ncbi:MAG: cupin domain-containing protein [Burkholderiales bacterium]
MSQTRHNMPLPIAPAPDPVDREFEALLSEPFAKAWAQPEGQLAGTQPLRDRLLGRVAASHAAGAVMYTAYRRRLEAEVLGAGVTAQTLYLAQAGRPPRAGEPLRSRLLELAAGALLNPDALGSEATLQSRHREWLVMSGRVELGGQMLGQRDYHVTPTGHATPTLCSADGALVFLRESEQPSTSTDGPVTVRDADAGWPDFAPGIQRRVLWQRDGQAAMLYYAQAGAQVPQHRHGHDEECLMLQGELFLDDLLLQTGDYQVAPVGTSHRITETDTGVVIYAHGDLDLQFTG